MTAPRDQVPDRGDGVDYPGPSQLQLLALIIAVAVTGSVVTALGIVEPYVFVIAYGVFSASILVFTVWQCERYWSARAREEVRK